MEKKHEKYFNANPDVDVFHFTTDGQAFRKKDVAQAHQVTLTKKASDIKTVNRKGKGGDDNNGQENPQPATSNPQQATSNQQQATGNPQPATSNRKQATSNKSKNNKNK